MATISGLARYTEGTGRARVCPSADAPPLDKALGQIAPLTEPFVFDDLKIVQTANYPLPAYRKLAVENI